jgi:hypothetical protein
MGYFEASIDLIKISKRSTLAISINMALSIKLL